MRYPYPVRYLAARMAVFILALSALWSVTR